MTTPDYTMPGATLRTGSMPLLGFGTWRIADSEASAAVQVALQAGYRHIDTATAYRNEAGIGAGLAAAGLPRDSVFVTTKLPPDHAGRARRTLEESLTRLGLDRVDLWLIHWPPNKKASPAVWEELINAQQAGLATSIGVSNYSLDQIDELIAATDLAPAVNQIRWAPAIFDATLAAGLRQRDVVLEGYSPFRVSNLSDPTLSAVAEAHGANTAQVIVAWHVAHGFVVIPKSAKPERIVSNAAGARLQLTDDEVSAIDGLSRV